MSSQRASEPPSPTTSPTLPRGSACLPCRRRKMRCDGGKPACGQCITKGRQDDCEYTGDLQGLTRTQMLEENISILESRIQELENPTETAPSVRLRSVPAPQAAASGSSETVITLRPPTLPYERVGHAAPGSRQAHMGAGGIPTQPTLQESYIMINSFIPHATQVGFFLNIPRFMHIVYTPADARSPFLDPLVTTVSLWGCRLSQSPALAVHESGLLSRAVQQLSGSLFLAGTDNHGHTIISVIQAEVLLANYFFSLGRFLEGRYHCSAAVSLCISCRLNVLGNEQEARGQGGLAMDLVRSSDLGFTPSEPGDAIHTGEKIGAFWSVYILDKTWAVALGAPSSISDNVRVSTPLPLTMEAYEQAQTIALNRNHRPIEQLLAGQGIDNLAEQSPLALRALASILLARASTLASQYQEDVINRDAYWNEFNVLQTVIARFINHLPRITIVSRGASSEVLVANTIARVASIQLHIRFAQDAMRSRESCLLAANSIIASVQNIGVNELRYLDPIMAILFSSASQVLISELKGYGAQSTRGTEHASSLTTSLDRILAVMKDFRSVCPLMASQIAQVEEARANAY